MVPLIISSLIFVLFSSLFAVGKKAGRSLNSPQVQRALTYWAWFKYYIGFCEYFILPDIVTHCVAHYPMLCHPDCVSESKAAVNWMATVSNLSAKGREYYTKVNYGELASRAYPFATTAERLRVTCDWMNYTFRLDDWLDDCEPEEARRLLDRCVEAMQDATHYQTTEPAPLLTKSWFQRMEKLSPEVKERMIIMMKGLFDGFARQAELRTSNHISTVNEYFAHRRLTIGVYPAMVLSEFAGAFFLPDDIFYLPLMRELEITAIDHIIYVNDILSYNIEQARGDDQHNLITILMHHEGMTLQEAMDYCGKKTVDCIDRFERDRKLVPTCGPELDEIVEKWILALQHWMSGNLHWHFVTARYIPSIGVDIMKGERHRYIKLYPKLLRPEAKS